MDLNKEQKELEVMFMYDLLMSYKGENEMFEIGPYLYASDTINHIFLLSTRLDLDKSRVIHFIRIRILKRNLQIPDILNNMSLDKKKELLEQSLKDLMYNNPEYKIEKVKDYNFNKNYDYIKVLCIYDIIKLLDDAYPNIIYGG